MKWLVTILLLVSLTASAETQIQLRRGTASQWTTANSVLTAAEIGVDLTNNSFRVGDGSTAWSDLPEYSVTEAPEDEAIYVRQDGEWAALMVEDVDLTADVTGVLPQSNGGTGKTSVSTALAKSFTAGEEITARQLINLYNDAGTVKARLADASDLTTQAHGFVYSPSAVGEAAIVFFHRGFVVSGLSSLTLGAQYYLSETAGEITATAPTTLGSIVQPIGVAISDSELLYLPGEAVVQ